MFSWETPIEQEILKFCNSMANRMREAEVGHKEHGWFANNRLSEDCGTMAKAYETVTDSVLIQIEFRNNIKNMKVNNEEQFLSIDNGMTQKKYESLIK